MSIYIVCPNCQGNGAVPDTFGGGRIKCPKCGHRFEVLTPKKKPDTKLFGGLADEIDEAPALTRTTRASVVEQSPSKSRTPLFVGIGVGAVALVGLIAGLVMMNGGSGSPRKENNARNDVVAAPSEDGDATSKQSPAKPEVVAISSNANTAPARPAADATKAVESANAPAIPASPAPPPAVVTPAETPEALVKRMTDATIFIKVQTKKVVGTGSGFVIKTEGDRALIATNHHVITPGLEDGDQDLTDTLNPRIEVTFRSGMGNGVAQTLPATLIAWDREDNRDLALLTVQGVKNPPRPIEITRPSEPSLTMPVMIFGFPFGEIEKMLHTGASTPAVTINKGSVSSLKRNEAGEIVYVQIDGSLNPGNSGGPIVDDHGRLVGVSVAQLRNTTIGFAVPPVELQRMLNGRLGDVVFEMNSVTGMTDDFRALARRIDPNQKLKHVALHFVFAQAVPPGFKPNTDGTWPKLPQAQRVDLQLGEKAALGSFKATLPDPKSRRLLVQTEYVTSEGKTLFNSPVPYDIPEQPGIMLAVGATPRGRKLPLAFDKLGPLVDPERDCKLVKDEKSLTITVPGKVHALNPEFKLKNAPRVLTQVSGDFMAQVKVAGVLTPGSEFARRTMPIAFHGAGLLLWQDDKNYLRLERTAGTDGGVNKVHKILIEVCKNNRIVEHRYVDVPELELSLRILRYQGEVVTMISPDGRQWISLPWKLALDFNDKVQVGLSASVTSKRPFNARFEDFSLVTESDKVSRGKSEAEEGKLEEKGGESSPGQGNQPPGRARP